MVFTYEDSNSRLRGKQVCFGETARIIPRNFQKVELEVNDLEIMLNTSEQKLKSKIGELIRVMYHNEHRIVKEQEHYKYPGHSTDMSLNPYTVSTDMFDGTGIDPNSFCVSERIIGRKPEPDASGLLWTED
jgi:hypothetical protein